MAREYNLGESSLTLSEGYQEDLGLVGDIWNWGVNQVKDIWNDWTGQTSQMREFEQQEYLQDKMNAYNTPVAQLERMRAAGINPNTAAAAIAGSGSESAQAPQVSTNTQGVSAGVNAAANLASSLGAGFGDTAKGFSDLFKLKPEVDKLENEARHELKKLGLTDASIEALLTDNKYRDENWQSELRLKGLKAENYAHEWDVMKSQHDLNLQMIDKALKDMEVADSEIGLNTSNAAYLDKLKEKTDFEAQWMKIRIDFWKERGFDILNSSIDMCIVQMIENGNSPQELLDKLYKYYGDKAYSIGKGEQKAIRDYAQSISFRRQKGESIASTRYSSPEDFSEAFWRVVKHYDNTLKDELSSVYKRFKAYPNDAKQIRRNLSAALGELTSDNVMMDDPDVRDLINEITDLLQFSDSALEQYFKNLGK